MEEHIRQSNLIEDIDDPEEDAQSMKAWEYISKQEQIGFVELLETHHLITVNQLNKKESGHFRTVPVWIGGYKLMPPASLVPLLTKNLLLDIEEHNLEVKETHVRFEGIHPFIDGNGRTGRMLMWWQQLQLSEKPTLVKLSKRAEYYKWFEEKKK